MRVPIYYVDAFTTRRFTGNPAAVMLFPRFIEDATLQAVAAENNLAETAFLVEEGPDYRLRWFTPTVEVPLCGHATLASAAVIMERVNPARTEVVFHTASGPLRVRRADGRYNMDFPARHPEQTSISGALVHALGAMPLEIWVEPFNYLVLLQDAATVRGLTPDLAAIARLNRAGVIVTAAGDQGYDIVSRYFAPAKGIPEDPVTGGAHCTLAPFWAPRLNKEVIRAYQASARGGQMTCRLRGDRVALEGSCIHYLHGEAEVDV
jgi:PhzF family phenazine biosynthesis protein